MTLQQQVTQLKGEIRSLQAQFAEIMGGAKGNQWRLPAEYWVIPAIDIDKAEVTPKVKPKAMSPKKKSEKATPKKKVTKAAPKIEGAVKKTSRKKVVAKAVPKKKEVAKATPRKRPTGQPLMPLKKIRAKVSCHLPVDAHEKEWIPSVGEKVAGKKRRSLDNYRRSSDPSMQEQKERDMLGIDIDGRVYLQKRKKGAVFFYKKTVVPGSTDFKEFHAVID